MKYFGSAVKDQNLPHSEIRSMLNSGNACHYYHLPPENLRLHKTIILPTFLDAKVVN
jgi:hypothetical protein